MQYGLFLIDKAAEKCGSYYALSKRMDVAEQTISAIRKGRRKVPLAWVYELATIAEVDAAWALQGVTAENASSEAKKSRLGKAAAAGAVGTSLFFYVSACLLNTDSAARAFAVLHNLYIVLSGGSGARRQKTAI